MSWTLVIAATPIDPASLQPDTAWTGERIVEALDEGAFTQELLMATSRNGGLAFNVKCLAGSLGLDALAVLDAEPWDAPGNAVGTLLHPAAMVDIVAAVDRAFDSVATDPDAVLAAGFEWSDAAELQEFATQAEASLRPTAEDGDDLASLFNFLRSLQALCQRSQADGRLVLVALMW